MKQFITFTYFLGVFSFAVANENKISKEEYISTWSEEAVSQMMEYGIPASITLAQAILESGNGNSPLAKKGNNHFGIKCHGWKGKSMKVDDDKKGECFRVYKDARESYEDHSLFLQNRQRYAFLFSYKKTDYKSWAKGLKKAGYATNPKYPQLLIKLIEENDLDELDRLSEPMFEPQPSIVVKEKNKKINIKSTNKVTKDYSRVKIHSAGVKYIVAEEGDTYYSIANSFGLTLRQLYRYNDVSSTKDVLQKGDIVFIQKKKRMKLFKKQEVILQKEMSLEELSQLYAVNSKTIKRLNGFIRDEVRLQKGQKVTLR